LVDVVTQSSLQPARSSTLGRSSLSCDTLGGIARVKPIIQIKDGLLGNLTTIVFSLAVAALAVWLDHRSHGEVSIFVWAFACVFVLFCYIPISDIRHPKSRTLLIEGDQLIWRIRDKEGEGVREERLPLRQIRGLRFVIPREAMVRRSRLLSCAELYFITAQGSERALPVEFFPGVYRDRIVAAVRQHVPDVHVEEVASAA
jgi:hypothetical protein